uniref:Arabinogalactan protein n=1 Tax=Panagrellus redivivus TaxID=6233 RepID=A0A7E4V4P1_PANRE
MLQLDDIFGDDGLVAFVTLFVGNLVILGVMAVNCGGKKDKAPAGGAPGAPSAGAPPPTSAGATPPPGAGGPGNPGAGSADVNVGPQSVHAFTAAAPPTPAA